MGGRRTAPLKSRAAVELVGLAVTGRYGDGELSESKGDEGVESDHGGG